MDDISVGKLLAWIFAIFVCITIFFGMLGVVLGVISLPFNIFNQANRIINKTIDADNVIYNYEWFKKVCGEIKAQDSIVDRAIAAQDEFEASAGDRSTWDWNDKNEHAMLRQNVTGAKNTRASMAQEYDARARMMNRAIFNTDSCDIQVAR